MEYMRKTCVTVGPLALLLGVALSVLGLAARAQASAAGADKTDAAPAAQSAPIPFDQIGAAAEKQYSGDGLSVVATADGARLRSVFQKLEAEATRDGLSITSTAPGDGGRLRLIASAIGRHGRLTNLPTTGTVVVGERVVTFTRPGLAEEYSVSVDGVRQDFVVAERPAGTGELRLELSLSGARAESVAGGAKITLDGSGRALVYGRLQVADATGRELAATIEVVGADRLALRVDDTGAAYPVRIDPTFSDADWVSLNPGIPGVNGSVNAAVVDGSGNLYVAGNFTFVGTVAANRIAKWDGSAWSALGLGTNAAVITLVVSGSALYAGGNFTTAGGVTANYVAKWDGSAWSALGSGMNYYVYALAVSGSDLYVGGNFITAGGVSAHYIAKWDGSVWSALGSGITGGFVYVLAVSGSDLYAGGDFTTAGGVSANRIAKWNGSAWSALGSGMTSTVYALAVSGSDLYVGGSFTTAGGVSANNIAKWNGSVWSALGSGMNNYVRALAVSGGDLYAGGDFTTAGGGAANYIAKWDGSAWSVLGSGMTSIVYALAVSGSDLYAAGLFSTAGGVSANKVAKWDGGAWSALGSGMTSTVYALAVSGSDLYAGGSFTAAGGGSTNGIAKWDGSAWSALGSGITGGLVYVLAVSGSDLYAGGSFTTAGGGGTNRIAKWDGSAWSALGSGMNNIVYVLAVSGSDLYAGGSFTTAGGGGANRIAKWDGSAWSALGSGMNNIVYALAVSGSDLYAGGSFTTAGGGGANRIAKWDGSAWSALGSGMNNYVRALAVSGGDLYAGGDFTTAGGGAANYIAKWDGSAWSALGSGMNSYVYALVADAANHLFVSGSFTWAGTILSPYIAQGNLSLPATPTIAPTGTSTATITGTPTDTQTSTYTSAATATVTSTPTVTDTPSGTPTPSPTATFFVSGSLLYYGSHVPVAGITVVGSTTLGGAPVVTVQSDSNGLYAMAGVPGGSWAVEPSRTEPTPWPQASIFRGVSSMDATWVQQYLTATRTFSANQFLAADTTGNGVISTLDAVRIQEYRIHLRERMPVAEICGSDWAFVPVPGPQGDPTPVAPAAAPTPCVRGAIAYASLTAGASGQDFDAVLYGDVTGNWTPAGGGSAAIESLTGGGGAASREALDSAPASLPAPPCDGPCAVVSSETAALVGPAGVLIAVNHLEDVQAFDVIVDVPDDAEVTSVKQAELSAAAGDCSLVWAANDGTLRISLACLTPVRGGGALVSLEIQGSTAGIALSKCVFDETAVSCGGAE